MWSEACRIAHTRTGLISAMPPLLSSDTAQVRARALLALATVAAGCDAARLEIDRIGLAAIVLALLRDDVESRYAARSVRGLPCCCLPMYIAGAVNRL